MKKYNAAYIGLFLFLFMALFMVACQKMERPPLGDFPEDPLPPPLQLLGSQSYWPFDGNFRDTGEFKMHAMGEKVAFVPGVAAIPDEVGGEAVKIDPGGYVIVTDVADGLKNPGSFSVAFWMKGAPGPIVDGAQGLFSIANSNEFWGNLEIFLENHNDPDDPNAAFIKMHLYNANISGGGEAWVDRAELRLKNVLDKWTHIAVVYDGATSEMTVYKDGSVTGLNGAEIGGGSYGSIKWENVSGFTIGNFSFQTSPSLTNHGPEDWAKSFNGAIDQFRLYTKPLSASEVKNLFDNKL